MSEPAPRRFIVAPPGGLITVGTIEEALARADEWRGYKHRPMIVYQLIELQTVLDAPPPGPQPRVV